MKSTLYIFIINLQTITIIVIWSSSPEDIILSEHVEESLPHELCDIPCQFVVTVIKCDTFLFTVAGLLSQ
jgi:hypothetical protein